MRVPGAVNAENLPLKQRPFDLFLAVVFAVFAVTTAMADFMPSLGVELTPDSPNFLVRMNYAYAADTDPLFLRHPFWMRLVTGLSAFVYAPFYVVLVWALVKGKNGIQLPAGAGVRGGAVRRARVAHAESGEVPAAERAVRGDAIGAAGAHAQGDAVHAEVLTPHPWTAWEAIASAPAGAYDSGAMTAVPHLTRARPRVAPPSPWRLTRARYHQLGELGVFDGRRVQLLEGTVFDMSPMGSPHSTAIRVLNRVLTSATVDLGLDVMVQLPLAASDDSEPEPDFAIIPTPVDELTDHPPTALLVIEVADSSLKLDLGLKAALYAACRVPEYWVIDLNGGTTVVHRRPGRSGYGSTRRVPWDKELKSSAVPSVKLTLSTVLRRARS